MSSSADEETGLGEKGSETSAIPKNVRQIGVSRPELPIDDLPTPEEVFKVPKISKKILITSVLGPSMIVLGAGIGSGEWLLGPLGFAKYGFMGIGFLVTVSAALQAFYNVENVRYIMATGEVPAVGFARTPPGMKLWVPLTLIFIYLSLIWGGWAAAAGQSIFTIFAGRSFDPGQPRELELVRIIAIVLLFLSVGIYLFGKKISRTMELIETTAVLCILAVVIILAILFTPGYMWTNTLISIVTPAALPKGIDATLLGSIIGFTGAASGMNFLMLNYYRDHGYGMGSKVGFFSGFFGGQKKAVLPSGITFRETDQNARTWKRWFRFLLIDQWGIFFPGAIFGMFITSMMVVSLTLAPGAAEPTSANMPTYVAVELGKKAAWLFPGMLILGALVLWKTQTTNLEVLIRNTTDVAISTSGRLRSWIGNDPRKFYFIAAGFFIAVISVIIHLKIPTELLIYSGNISNLAAIVFPLVLIYLNRQLPKPARAGWWTYPVLIANVLFFGFFFSNFVFVQITGHALVKF
jgi:hypothetical protein